MESGWIPLAMRPFDGGQVGMIKADGVQATCSLRGFLYGKEGACFSYILHLSPVSDMAPSQ